jgi:hypothetical protein
MYNTVIGIAIFGHARFEDLSAVVVKSSIVWDVVR